MKILAKTTRGTSYRVTGDKRFLRDIVDKIYDEVELRGVVDYFANIRSAGKGYMIEYFRLDDGWMDKSTADRVSSDIEDIVSELGYEDNVDVELKEEKTSFIVEEYGHPCYKVIVRVHM